jgi:hypothetical protein
VPARPTDDPVAHREGWIRIAVQTFEAELRRLETTAGFMQRSHLLDATTAGKIAATVVHDTCGAAQRDA